MLPPVVLNQSFKYATTPKYHSDFSVGSPLNVRAVYAGDARQWPKLAECVRGLPKGWRRDEATFGTNEASLISV